MLRRDFVRMAGAAGVALTAGIGFGRPARAAKSIRFATPEADPSQIKSWEKIFGDFTKAASIEVKPEFAKWDDLSRKLAADIVAGEPPEVVAGSSKPGFVADAAKRGLVIDLASVVDELGRDDFSASALGAWQFKGMQMAVPYGQQWPVLWCRTDLFAEAGVEIPETWDDYKAACEKLHNPDKGIYAAVFPAGRTWNTHIQSLSHIWSAGGLLFDEKLDVALDSPETVKAIRYYAEMVKRFSPPDAANYGFREAAAAYTTGRSATTLYWGRVLSHLYRDKKELLKVSKTVHIPRDKVHRTSLHFDELYVHKSKNQDMGRQLVKFMLGGDQMFRLMTPVIGHVVPTRTSVVPRLQEHDWIRTNPDIVTALIAPNGAAVSALKESPAHPFNYKYDAVVSKNILPDMVQKVVVGGDTVESAVSWAHKEAVDVTKDISG